MHVHFPISEIPQYNSHRNQQHQQVIHTFNSNNINSGNNVNNNNNSSFKVTSQMGILNLVPTNQASSLSQFTSLSLHSDTFSLQGHTQHGKSNSNAPTISVTSNNTSNLVAKSNDTNNDNHNKSTLFPLEELFLNNAIYNVINNSHNDQHDNFCPVAVTCTTAHTTAATNTMTDIISDNNNDDYDSSATNNTSSPQQTLFRKQTIVESLHALVQQFNIERNIYLQEYINCLSHKFNIKIDDDV